MSRPAQPAGARVAWNHGARATVVRALALAAVLLILAYLAATWSARIASEAHPTLATAWPEPPLVMAHQGGDGLWPSSTRYAFDRAVTLGVDVLEMDVHLSQDGRLVVIHDDTVDRTTDASGAVADHDAETLAAMDAGWSWSPGPATGRVPYRGFGYGVPALADVLNDHPDAPVAIEIKPEGPEAATALCRRLREEGRTAGALVASFHQDAMDAFRNACPDVATSATRAEARTFVILSRLRLAGPLRPRFDALQVPVEQGGLTVATPSLLGAAHAKGVQVHVWTINDPDAMQRLLRMGVDGLITDRPDRALRATGREVDEALLPPFVTP
ncbi:MAG: glycerophosphodiester phosphodiesterase [Trueperaceae bacterium]|nr:glycerophosphodiester phosphodiesterase [Trueperaceae bacterium]